MRRQIFTFDVYLDQGIQEWTKYNLLKTVF